MVENPAHSRCTLFYPSQSSLLNFGSYSFSAASNMSIFNILALTVNFKWQKGGFHHRKAQDHTKRDKLKEEEDSLGVPGLFGPSSNKLGN